MGRESGGVERLARIAMGGAMVFLIISFMITYPEKAACNENCKIRCENGTLKEAAGALMWAKYSEELVKGCLNGTENCTFAYYK